VYKLCYRLAGIQNLLTLSQYSCDVRTLVLPIPILKFGYTNFIDKERKLKELNQLNNCL